MDTSFAGRERSSAPAHSIPSKMENGRLLQTCRGCTGHIPGSQPRQITHRPVKYTLSEVLVLAMLISISHLFGLDV